MLCCVKISLPPAQPGGANSGGSQQAPTVFLYTSNNDLYTSDVIVVMITVDNSLIIAVPMARIPYGTYYVLLNASELVNVAIVVLSPDMFTCCMDEQCTLCRC